MAYINKKTGGISFTPPDLLINTLQKRLEVLGKQYDPINPHSYMSGFLLGLLKSLEVTNPEIKPQLQVMIDYVDRKIKEGVI